MNNKGQMDSAELKIQSAIGAFLKSRSSLAGNSAESGHLDEDVLTAFVEGSLGEKESSPVISHLVNCSFCRHVSAELIRLESVFSEEPVAAESQSNEPVRVGDVLSGILSRIFGSDSDAVFAHEEKEPTAEDESDRDGDKA